MKKIKLTQGKIALVDDADFEELNKYKWFAHKDKKTFYAHRNFKKSNGKQSMKIMHRIILGEPKSFVDHKDGDGLNNQRHNLRFCNHSSNGMNRGKNINNKSGFKGVSWDKKICKWQTQIFFNGKAKHLGYFINNLEAYKTYCEAAKKYHKEFAFF